jgi:hypothetical protein
VLEWSAFAFGCSRRFRSCGNVGDVDERREMRWREQALLFATSAKKRKQGKGGRGASWTVVGSDSSASAGTATRTPIAGQSRETECHFPCPHANCPATALDLGRRDEQIGGGGSACVWSGRAGHKSGSGSGGGRRVCWQTRWRRKDASERGGGVSLCVCACVCVRMYVCVCVCLLLRVRVGSAP